MTWLQRYRIRSFLRNSIWFLPVFAIAIALGADRLLFWAEQSIGWQSTWHPETLKSVLGTLAGSIFTFIVFVCTSLLLVVQLASAQLSPRVIGIILRDPVIKITLASFVFVFTFVLAAIARTDEHAPAIRAQLAVYSCLACVGVFLYLVDRIGKTLRPNGVFEYVATKAHRVIENVYPRRLKTAAEPHDPSGEYLLKQPMREITSRIGGVVLAFDKDGLVSLAKRHHGVIEIVPQVGEFVAPGDPLFRVMVGSEIAASALYQSIALGAERTMEQDPAFAFRIIVDVASKGLSPTINDPTTAVLAIDRIHHLLRHVGNRRLDNEKVCDAAGDVRLLFRTPDWDDFVRLAVTEIRHFGGSCIQIPRRLRAMLEDLIEKLPEQRATPLRRELKLLTVTTKRFFSEPEERALAESSDLQGVGGVKDRE